MIDMWLYQVRDSGNPDRDKVFGYVIGIFSDDLNDNDFLLVETVDGKLRMNISDSKAPTVRQVMLSYGLVDPSIDVYRHMTSSGSDTDG